MSNEQVNAVINAVIAVTDFEADKRRRVLRMINPVLNMIMTVVISATEPSDEVLPINVIWINMNLKTDDYRYMMQRVSKTAAGEYQNEWKRVTHINTLYAPQYYDPSDNTGSTLKAATETELGIARLTTAPKDIGRPVFVSETDPRNTDARHPKAHMHPEKPAARLATQQNDVNIVSAPAVAGQTLVAETQAKAKYEQLKAQELGSI